ncbi:putative potassium transport system protein kup 1 [Gammaproteobacteria bacterium]
MSESSGSLVSSTSPEVTPLADSTTHPKTASLLLATLGVVYGDIGTSPLYTIRECFRTGGATVITADILGMLSLLFWSLIVVVTIKYVFFVMRADNRGEGGILALTALVLRAGEITNRERTVFITIGLIGAALFYGDGMITPAISVLSAVEGMEIATPILTPYVVPVAIAVLMGLFLIQSGGTARVGALFGPVMLIWFITIALLGIVSIIQSPKIITALDPRHGLLYFSRHGVRGGFILGAVVLALTGAEALYADMGHFSRQTIRMAWLFFVLPALVLNYFGQGALLLRDPSAVENPFYRLVPTWGLYPLVVLSVIATIIASQAVISGAYSLTKEALQLGFLPRMRICHTSSAARGQIYLPMINWSLAIAVVLLVVGFGSSDALAAAYGIAVTGTMISTTLLMAVVARRLWHWPLIVVLIWIGAALLVDFAFFGVNLLKVNDGGWFPLAIGAGVYLLMLTWKQGREMLSERLADHRIPVDSFLESIALDPPIRVPGTAVFMTASSEGIPHALLHNLHHNHVLHEQVVLLTVLVEEVPIVDSDERVEIQHICLGFERLTIRYGFSETPDVPKALTLCESYGLAFDPMTTSFFLSRETLIPSLGPGMMLWREHIFAAMARNSGSATDFLRLPINRVVELGTQVEL